MPSFPTQTLIYQTLHIIITLRRLVKRDRSVISRTCMHLPAVMQRTWDPRDTVRCNKTWWSNIPLCRTDNTRTRHPAHCVPRCIELVHARKLGEIWRVLYGIPVKAVGENITVLSLSRGYAGCLGTTFTTALWYGYGEWIIWDSWDFLQQSTLSSRRTLTF